MDSYLQTLAARFAAEQTNSQTFVFPNRRAGLFFRKYYGQVLTRPIIAPEIMTINDCFHSLTDLHVPDQLDLIARLYRIYQAQFEHPDDAEPLEQFLHWGQMMLADFSEIDNHLIPHVKDLLTTIRDWQQLNNPAEYLTENQREAIHRFWGEVLEQKINLPTERFLHTWDLLYPCYEQLRHQLLDEGLAYEGLLHRHVIEHWAEITDDKFHEQYVFIGFNALTGSEEKLMLLLQEKGIADFYFDYSTPLLHDPANRASLFMQHNRQIFKSRLDIPVVAPDTHIPAITHISIPSDIGETHQVYRILNELYPAKTVHASRPDWTRTAVVLPDETLLIPLLHALPEQIDKINVTMGYPLRATREFIPIRQALTEPVDATAREAIERLRHFWDEARTQDNSEIIFHLQSLLNRIEDVFMPDLSVTAFYQLLHLLAANATVSYTGEPLNGLQVMGVLETRALDFDNLIITGFNDDLYPGKSKGNSFIPFTLRRGFGLPTPERQDAIFAYNFYRMLSYAKQVWLITNSLSDDQHMGEVSRYLHQLRYQFHIPIKEQTIILGESAVSDAEAIIPLPPPRTASDQSSIISPSALTTFLRCQRQYYYRHVAHLQEEQQDVDGVDDRTLGTAVHATIATLYEPYIGKNITPADITNIQQQLPSRWETLPSLAPIKHDAIAMAVAKFYVDSLLALDYSHPFRYIASEKKVFGSINIDNHSIPLMGIIDRIDQVGNSIRLIDYKTGHAENTYKDLEQVFTSDQYPYVLQTLYYCYLVRQAHITPSEQKVEAHLFQLRKLGSDQQADTLVHPKEDENGSFDYNQVSQQVEDNLRLLIRTILHTNDFPRTDTTRKCENCGFASICR